MTSQLLLLLVPNGQYNSIVLEMYVHCVPSFFKLVKTSDRTILHEVLRVVG